MFEVLHCLFLVMSKGCYLKQNPSFVPLRLADSQCSLLEMPGEREKDEVEGGRERDRDGVG